MGELQVNQGNLQLIPQGRNAMSSPYIWIVLPLALVAVAVLFNYFFPDHPYNQRDRQLKRKMIVAALHKKLRP